MADIPAGLINDFKKTRASVVALKGDMLKKAIEKKKDKRLFSVQEDVEIPQTSCESLECKLSCIHAHIAPHTCAQTHTHMHAHTCAQTHTHMHAHTCTRTHAHTHTHTYTHKCIFIIAVRSSALRGYLKVMSGADEAALRSYIQAAVLHKVL